MKLPKLELRKRWVITGFLLIALGFASYGAAQAIAAVYKVVAGTGTAVYLNEVSIVSQFLLGNDRYMVRLQPQPIAQADVNYTVTLYFDGVPISLASVSWTIQQVTNQVVKNVVFVNLDFSTVVDIGVEITR